MSILDQLNSEFAGNSIDYVNNKISESEYIDLDWGSIMTSDDYDVDELIDKLSDLDVNVKDNAEEIALGLIVSSFEFDFDDSIAMVLDCDKMALFKHIIDDNDFVEYQEELKNI